MTAPVLSLPPVKFPAAPSPLTPEQTYWRTFKSQQLIPSSSNNPITHISFPPAPANPLTVPSDHFIVTAGPRVQIYSIRSRKLVKQIARFDDVAHSGEVRRDGRVLVAGDESGAIQVFDVASRAILKTWKEHKQPVWTTKFSPFEPSTLLSGGDDRTLRLWDLPSGASTSTFIGHHDYVRTAAFLADQASGLVISGSYDQTVKVWDPRTPANAVMNFKHDDPIESVLSMPSGRSMVAAAGNHVAILDIVAARPLQVLQTHQKAVTSLCLATKNQRLVCGGLDGHVKILETENWNIVAGSKYPSPILSLSIVSGSNRQEDRHVVVGMQSGILSIKTRLSGQQKVKAREREKEMQALIEGKTAALDRKRAKKETSGWKKRLRGHDFTGEGADIIITGPRQAKQKSLSPAERLLHKGKYPEALDKVLEQTGPSSLTAIITILTALRHRSALRAALSGRDEVTLQPVLKWAQKHIIDAKYVQLCVDICTHVLDLYAAQLTQSILLEKLVRDLHACVQTEVGRAQQAWQTQGMIDMLMDT